VVERAKGVFGIVMAVRFGRDIDGLEGLRWERLKNVCDCCEKVKQIA